MTPALRTRGLSKQFGAFKANSDVTLALRAGRAPRADRPQRRGQDHVHQPAHRRASRRRRARCSWASENITALAQHERVKRGMTRTFQINTLFPGLTVLESVVLAICEREGRAGVWHQHGGAAARGGRRGERRCSTRLHLGARARARSRAICLRQAAAGRDRAGAGDAAAILLLDEPAAGIPAGESAELFGVIAGLPRDVTIVFIEHDMELVFRFAERITVLVGGRGADRRHAGGDRRRPAREGGLPRRGAAWLSCSRSRA